MINKMWGFFIIIGIVFTIATGNIDSVNDTILTSAKSGVNMVLELIPIIVLWSGIMKIAENSGLLNVIAKFFQPVLGK